MRLILSVTFAMVVTHLLVLLAIAEFFGREQRLDRAQQMARLVAFIKPRVEIMPDLPIEVPLGPHAFRVPNNVDAKGAPAEPVQFRGRPPAPELRPGEPEPRDARPPIRELPTMTITTQLPVDEVDADLLEALREVVPEIAHVAYFDLAGWPSLGPERRYRIESWTRLANGKYLKTVIEDTGFQKERPHPGFAVIDLGARIPLSEFDSIGV
jgi:hypothetical protein